MDAEAEAAESVTGFSTMVATGEFDGSWFYWSCVDQGFLGIS